ncbi:MAG: adenylyltransferase/cytidyltransferase family protein, partial [Calditrichia bacterium]|nr:adenylyltransferase/cytidyltransferase family protein [Calditrichia bacterium]
MEVLQNSDVTKTGIPSVVTVGTFDGVHLGHMKIIDKVIADAESEGYQSVLVTFNPHPQQVVRRNNNDVLLLTSIGEKLQILKNTGLDTIVIIPFTQEFSQTEYKDFLTSYLIEKLNMKKFVLGYDAALGHERKGHLEQIKEHALQNNYSLDIVSPFKVEETVINSTLIRKKLQLAECENVKKYLGRAYNIQGKVVKGDNRGAGLGFPTANIIPDCKDKL